MEVYTVPRGGTVPYEYIRVYTSIMFRGCARLPPPVFECLCIYNRTQIQLTRPMYGSLASTCTVHSGVIPVLIMW